MIPAFLSELVRTVIIMTVSGGLIVLVLLLIKPVVRHRLPKSAQYYFWLVALFALLAPLSRIIILPDAVPNISPVHAVVERNVISIEEETVRMLELADAPWQAYAAANNIAPEDAIRAIRPDFTPPPELPPAGAAMLSTALMLVYPWAVLSVLFYSIISYMQFVGKLRRGHMQPHQKAIEMLNDLTRGKRAPRLIVSTYAETPMLTGIFRPTIALPRVFAAQVNREADEYSTEQLYSILLHELTHMRRFDIAIKWLSLLACAIHWFNPLVWVLRREIDMSCELSCDEVVIRDMDVYDRQSYGDALISVSSNRKIPLSVMSTTMCAEKRALKERLAAIMKNKKHTKLAIAVSVIIILAAVLTVGAVGASRGQSAAAGEGLSSPQTVHDYAMMHIEEMTEGLSVLIEDTGIVRPVNILDTHINVFEQIFGFNNIIANPIEMWRLDFMIQTDDIEDGNLRWGTFAPDSEGWVGKHMGWHDADVIMVFIMNPSGLEFLGNLGRWESYEVIDAGSAERALRSFLEDLEVLVTEPIPHVGAAHETQRIVSSLPLPDENWILNSVQIGADHGDFGYGAYTLTVFYDILHSVPHWLYQEYMPGADFEANAARLFSLIENLQAVTFSVNSLAASDVSDYHYRWSITRESSTMGGGAVVSSRGVSRPFSRIEVTDEIVITIRSIEGFLHLYDVFWDDMDWRAMPVVFETSVPISDFRWLEMVYANVGGTYEYQVQSTLYHIDELRPDIPFAVTWREQEGLPHRGISFVDENGGTRYFGLRNHRAPDIGGPFVLFDIHEWIVHDSVGEQSVNPIIPAGVLTLIDALQIGMTRVEAESLFPSSAMPHRVARAYGSGYSYRYDLIKDDDYEFVCPIGADTVDSEGLQEGRVRLIVFIDFNAQDIIESYVIYYSIWDGSIYEIRVHPAISTQPVRIIDGGDWNHDDSRLWS